MGVRRARAACGLSTRPRWRRCRRSCTSGVAKTPSQSAGAWRGQVTGGGALSRFIVTSDCLVHVLFPFSSECLDRLLAERPDRLRTLPPYPNPAPTPRVPPVCIPSNSCNQALLQLSGPSHHHHQHQVHPQQPCYLSPPPATHPCNPFGVHSPCGQPTATGALNSPVAGKMPPDYCVAQQVEYSFGPRSVQDFLLEGDSGYDVDTLNPSLTDLQLQGIKLSIYPSVYLYFSVLRLLTATPLQP